MSKGREQFHPIAVRCAFFFSSINSGCLPGEKWGKGQKIKEWKMLHVKVMQSLLICNYLMQIAGKINKVIKDQGLKDLGQLEQDLVFGNAGTKELITFLRTQQVA